MSTPNAPDCQGPDPHPHAARFKPPPGACDSHAHVIGPPERYPFVATRSFTPPPAPEAAYLAMHDALGIERGVLVQVSVHGTDNSLMLRTLEAHRGRLRGIAVIRPDPSDAELRRLKASGVVGLRLNATTGGGVGVADLESYDALCAELGWHLQFLVEPHQLMPLAGKIAKLRVPAVFDHMG